MPANRKTATKKKIKTQNKHKSGQDKLYAGIKSEENSSKSQKPLSKTAVTLSEVQQCQQQCKAAAAEWLAARRVKHAQVLWILGYLATLTTQAQTQKGQSKQMRPLTASFLWHKQMRVHNKLGKKQKYTSGLAMQNGFQG